VAPNGNASKMFEGGSPTLTVRVCVLRLGLLPDQAGRLRSAAIASIHEHEDI